MWVLAKSIGLMRSGLGGRPHVLVPKSAEMIFAPLLVKFDVWDGALALDSIIFAICRKKRDIFACKRQSTSQIKEIPSDRWHHQPPPNLFPTHRLDKLTSGVLIFARKKEKSRLLMKQFTERMIKKKYICRVDGDFPEGIVSCDAPIRYPTNLFGVCSPGQDSKHCTTEFQKVSYNGRTSLVICMPKTGRTHQIRIHLQYLGHPIANDTLYTSEIFEKERGKLTSDLKLDNELMQTYRKACIHAYQFGYPTSNKDNGSCSSQHQYVHENIENSSYSKVNHPKFDPSKLSYDPDCYDCNFKFKDPRKEDLLIYLHAMQYIGPDWMFEAPLPYWAKDDFLL
ncbi:RNA pseudouridylate synthase domain-containing protein 2 [Nymphon striatum]|nr:RNA pseudouridylate synthase domain-containing protein 2 [Nymphon striatum]